MGNGNVQLIGGWDFFKTNLNKDNKIQDWIESIIFFILAKSTWMVPQKVHYKTAISAYDYTSDFDKFYCLSTYLTRKNFPSLMWLNPCKNVYWGARLFLLFQTHSGSVWKVTWAHPEFGQVIATCSFDRTAVVWEERGTI